MVFMRMLQQYVRDTRTFVVSCRGVAWSDACSVPQEGVNDLGARLQGIYNCNRVVPPTCCRLHSVRCRCNLEV